MRVGKVPAGTGVITNGRAASAGAVLTVGTVGAAAITGHVIVMRVGTWHPESPTYRRVGGGGTPSPRPGHHLGGLPGVHAPSGEGGVSPSLHSGGEPTVHNFGGVAPQTFGSFSGGGFHGFGGGGSFPSGGRGGGGGHR